MIRPILTHRHAILSDMDLAARFHSQCADLRDKLRFARTQQALARRQGDTRRVRSFHRAIVKCLRALRYAARMESGRAQHCSHCSHPLFSDTPEKASDASQPTAFPETNRRRAFRERLRRR